MRRVRSLLDRLGVAGVLGLGVLLACAAFYFSALRPAEKDLGAKTRTGPGPVSRDIAPADLERFYALFPPLAEVGDGLESVYAIARAAGLDYQQGDYRIERRGAGLVAYRVSLPARGSYPQLREFTQTVLTRMPTASIDQLRFERRKAGDARLETQVRLTLYFRPQEGTR